VSDEILTERRGRVLVITINRPKRGEPRVSQGLADAVDELDDSGDMSVAVITGAGMDLNACAAGEVVAIPGRGIARREVVHSRSQARPGGGGRRAVAPAEAHSLPEGTRTRADR
jgi:enoyl-CoA hydratase/carnithine racemase